MALDRAPKVFNEVELAMIFGKENAKVSRGLDDFLHQGFLSLEIRLKFEYALATTVDGVVFALLAPPTHVRCPKASLMKNLFESFRLVRIRGMIGRERHLLWVAITGCIDKPAISKQGLFATRIDIHPSNE